MYLPSQSFSWRGRCRQSSYIARKMAAAASEMKSYSLLSPGGFMSGPRTLRSERLQWLTTSAVNRQASIGNTLWSLTVGSIARTAPNRSIYRVDTVRSGALEELAFRPKTLRLLTAFSHFVFEISARLKAVNRHSPPFFFFGEAMS